jgi:hypothetical protein
MSEKLPDSAGEFLFFQMVAYFCMIEALLLRFLLSPQKISSIAAVRRGLMIRQKFILLFSALFCFSIYLAQADKCLAQEKELSAADVIAKHLDSIGKPEILAKVKSRGISGKAAFSIVQGGTGSNSDGKFICLSEGKNVGLTMKFNDINYPGEYLAFNGKDATVKDMTPGHKSPLSDFIFRYNGIMKEGFIGGVLSVAWPLLSYKDGQPLDFIYKLEQVKDRKYHVLEKKLGDVRVKLFFDTKTFHHVKTEYLVRHKNDTSANSTVLGEATADTSVDQTTMRKLNDIAPKATIHENEPDSIFTLTEKFDQFMNVGGLSIPAVYGIEFSAEGHGTSFVGEWSVIAESWVNNGAKIDQGFFVAK